MDKTLFEKVDSKELKKLFKQIEDSVKDRVMSLYETECDGETNYIKKVLFDRKMGRMVTFILRKIEKLKRRNVILMKKSSKGNSSKRFDEVDWNKLQEVEKMDASGFLMIHIMKTVVLISQNRLVPISMEKFSRTEIKLHY